MPQPFQLALNFTDSELDNTPVSDIPIDKYFPEDEANNLAAFEAYNKHLYRPNTYLHKCNRVVLSDIPWVCVQGKPLVQAN